MSSVNLHILEVSISMTAITFDLLLPIHLVPLQLHAATESAHCCYKAVPSGAQLHAFIVAVAACAGTI